jgi:glycosyltransferase involved in cell wall biosynthesis
VGDRRLVSGAAPAVSVVIPCYNHGRFLRDAVGSVQKQTFGDFEVIVVDDGSVDETPAVVASLTDVRQIRQAHQGLSAARNAGWRSSRGRYLVFLDADDRLLPHALQVGVEHLQAHPAAAFVSGHHIIIDAAGAQVARINTSCVTSDHYAALLRWNYIGMHATVVYRREALERFGGFDPTLRACEDYDLFLRVARQAPIVCHPDFVAEYRSHGANMSRDHALMLDTALAVLRRQRRHVLLHPAYARAYREGLAFWRDTFGGRLMDDVGARVSEGAAWAPTARMLAVLIRLDPRGLARRVAGYARRRWQTRGRR